MSTVLPEQVEKSNRISLQERVVRTGGRDQPHQSTLPRGQSHAADLDPEHRLLEVCHQRRPLQLSLQEVQVPFVHPFFAISIALGSTSSQSGQQWEHVPAC